MTYQDKIEDLESQKIIVERYGNTLTANLTYMEYNEQFVVSISIGIADAFSPNESTSIELSVSDIDDFITQLAPLVQEASNLARDPRPDNRRDLE